MISIIGAGPIGAYLAWRLAKEGENVRLFEEHPNIGRPVQCAGIVSKNIRNFVNIDKEFVLNTINGTRIYSPNGECFEIKGDKEAYILDRAKFDSYLVEKALDENVELYLGYKFLSMENGNLIFDRGGFKTDVLVGADGPLSGVAKNAEMFNNRKNLIGIQVRAFLDKETDFVELYFGEEFPGFFGWVIPEGKGICRIGIAGEEVSNNFNKFLRRFSPLKIIEKQGGLIPVYNKNIQIQKDNVFLVGDAAAQNKATTGGGIVFGLKAAKILSDCLIDNKNYEREIKRKLKKDLDMNLKIRLILNKFDNEKYNSLIKLLNQDKIKEFFVSNGDMDYPTKFGFGLAIREPRLLKFLF